MNGVNLVPEIMRSEVVGIMGTVANRKMQVLGKGASDNGLSPLLPCFSVPKMDPVLLDIVFF